MHQLDALTAKEVLQALIPRCQALRLAGVIDRKPIGTIYSLPFPRPSGRTKTNVIMNINTSATQPASAGIFNSASFNAALPANPQPLRLVRLPEVLQRIGVSRSTLYAGIKTGRFPRGHAFGERLTVWRSDDIDRFVASVGQTQEVA
ncbi:helix-turn-helix transcriptional regulator [Ottowia sp. VDI28]|uniref:helix-turn-helix transcriptional regulator n=1 Tax=Ottowia sp. VDI28 TaxID=3133968 RepID=UPI003C2C6CCC